MNNKRILVVDDNPQVVALLKMRLELAGFEVIAAHDGYEGLVLARKEKPDLIILDVMLPKMNGYQICRFLKYDKKYKHIPIIILTSRAKQSDVVIGKKAGTDEYIFKPYNPKKLLELINKYLNKNKN